MYRSKTYNRKKIVLFTFVVAALSLALIVRLFYIMVLKSDYYIDKATKIQERERDIKAARGEILDRNGTIIATNKTVCTISVIYNQVTDKEKVIKVLSDELSTLNYDLTEDVSSEEMQNLLNKMWRNNCINDTYEPGSTFKIVTAAAGLEEGVVTMDSTFSCPGYRVVEDRRIRCAKVVGHGSETFLQGTMNSCNPVFIDVGLRVGAENYYKYMQALGLLGVTGVDLPGEASTIMHKLEDIGLVELATMSFGQSFQITPIQLLRAASCVINGGTLVTPHFATKVCDSDGNVIKEFEYETVSGVISKETSETMKYMLEKVVSEGGGNKAYIEGYRIGGKTATSQKLPRSACKYISSFIGFAPADDPQVIAICIVDEPEGVYYGGTVSAPVIKVLFENILPYLIK